MMRNLPSALEDSLHVSQEAEIGRNGHSRTPPQSLMRGVAGRSSATPRKFLYPACLLAAILATSCASLTAQPLTCDFTNYRPGHGLRAAPVGGDVLLEWGSDPAMTLQGTFGRAPVGDVENRAIIGIERGQPVVRILATTGASGDWLTLARDADLVAHVAEINEPGEQELLQRRAGTTPGTDAPETTCRLSDQPLHILRPTGHPVHRQPRPAIEPKAAAMSCEVRRIGPALELLIDVGAVAGHQRTLLLTVRSNSRVLRHEEVLALGETSARPGSRPRGMAVVAGLGDIRASGHTELVWLGGDGDLCRKPYAASPAEMTDTPMTVRAAEPVLALGRSQGSLAVLSPSPLESEPAPGKLWHWQGHGARLALGIWREVPQSGQDELAGKRGSPSDTNSPEKPPSDSAVRGLHLVLHYFLGVEGPKATLFEAVGQRSGPEGPRVAHLPASSGP